MCCIQPQIHVYHLYFYPEVKWNSNPGPISVGHLSFFFFNAHSYNDGKSWSNLFGLMAWRHTRGGSANSPGRDSCASYRVIWKKKQNNNNGFGLNSLVSVPLIFEYIPVFLCVLLLFPHETAYKSPLDQANGPRFPVEDTPVEFWNIYFFEFLAYSPELSLQLISGRGTYSSGFGWWRRRRRLLFVDMSVFHAWCRGRCPLNNRNCTSVLHLRTKKKRKHHDKQI